MSHPQPGSPDVGMALIAGRFAGDQPDTPTGAAAEVSAAAQLLVVLGNLSRQMARQRERSQAEWANCHPIPLNPIAAPAAGTVSDERWEPREGFAWQITRLSVVSSTATGWGFFRDTAAGTGQYMANGVPSGLGAGFYATWEPKGEFLLPGNRLIPQAFGGAAIFNGQAIEIALDWLPAYLL